MNIFGINKLNFIKNKTKNKQKMKNLTNKINDILERSRLVVSKKERTKILYEAFVLMNKASDEIDFSEFYYLVKEKRDDLVPYTVYLLYYSTDPVSEEYRIL